MRKQISKGLGVLLLCFALAGVGCSSTTQTRPGVSESDGTYEMFVGFDQGTTWNAVSDAARELGYVVTKRDRPADGTWTLRARDAGSNRITIGVEPGTLESSRVTVRIDPGQNDSMSQLVLRAIRDQLPEPVN